MRETLHTTTVARVLHQSQLFGREPLLKKTHIKYQLEFAKRHVGDSMVKWKKVLCSVRPKWSFFSTAALFHKALIGEEPRQQLLYAGSLPSQLLKLVTIGVLVASLTSLLLARPLSL